MGSGESEEGGEEGSNAQHDKQMELEVRIEGERQSEGGGGGGLIEKEGKEGRVAMREGKVEEEDVERRTQEEDDKHHLQHHKKIYKPPEVKRLTYTQYRAHFLNLVSLQQVPQFHLDRENQ